MVINDNDLMYSNKSIYLSNNLTTFLIVIGFRETDCINIAEEKPFETCEVYI